jgi:hypothetical protein
MDENKLSEVVAGRRWFMAEEFGVDCVVLRRGGWYLVWVDRELVASVLTMDSVLAILKADLVPLSADR